MYPKTEQGYTYDTPDVWDAPADKSPWYGAWWGGNLRGVKDHPIDLGSDKLNAQIVYSPHDYGPSVYAQSWFNKDFTTQTLLDDYWYDTWAYINDQDIAPLLIGEWGGHMDGGKNQHWMELLRDYMIENHINHTFWCLNPNSGDTGGLLDSMFANWDEEKYALFEESLWQTSTTGKYIGLDHQHPLGVNGMGLSLSEYYDTYAESEGSNINGGKELPPPDDQPTDPVPSETDETVDTTETNETSEPTETDASETTGGDAVYGDVNSDGEVDILDVIALNKFLLGSVSLSADAQKNADVDGNETIDSTDSLNILKKVVKIIDTLPVV